MTLICKHCNGTGIKNKLNIEMNHSIFIKNIFYTFDGECDKCIGEGFSKVDWIDLIFECPELYNKDVYRFEY